MIDKFGWTKPPLCWLKTELPLKLLDASSLPFLFLFLAGREIKVVVIAETGVGYQLLWTNTLPKFDRFVPFLLKIFRTKPPHGLLLENLNFFLAKGPVLSLKFPVSIRDRCACHYHGVEAPHEGYPGRLVDFELNWAEHWRYCDPVVPHLNLGAFDAALAWGLVAEVVDHCHERRVQFSEVLEYHHLLVRVAIHKENRPRGGEYWLVHRETHLCAKIVNVECFTCPWPPKDPESSGVRWRWGHPEIDVTVVDDWSADGHNIAHSCEFHLEQVPDRVLDRLVDFQALLNELLDFQVTLPSFLDKRLTATPQNPTPTSTLSLRFFSVELL